VSPDLDDTIVPGPRPVHGPRGDVDDTVVRTSRPDPSAGDTAASPPHALPDPGVSTAHYAFRVGPAGRPVRLDVVAYLGRGPKPRRVFSGEPPRLIRVESPTSEVSNTHLEIRQLGASVVLTDLHSTNGSIVVVPGSTPHRLRQGESMVVTPGTLVDIGDGNVVEILPLQCAGHDDA
jgi:hypothetical protein